jgi:hypothetical protein
VIEAYRHKRLTPARTVELLHDTIGEADLPDPDDTRRVFGRMLL